MASGNGKKVVHLTDTPVSSDSIPNCLLASLKTVPSGDPLTLGILLSLGVADNFRQGLLEMDEDSSNSWGLFTNPSAPKTNNEDSFRPPSSDFTAPLEEMPDNILDSEDVNGQSVSLDHNIASEELSAAFTSTTDSGDVVPKCDQQLSEEYSESGDTLWLSHAGVSSQKKPEESHGENPLISKSGTPDEVGNSSLVKEVRLDS